MNNNKMFGEKIERNIRYNAETDTYYVQFNFSPTKTARLRGFPTLEDARTYRDTISAEKLKFKTEQDLAIIREREEKEIKKIVPYPYNVFRCTSLRTDDISGFFVDNFNEILNKTLNEREVIFIKRFFANGLTLQQIGKENQITRERVRQVIAVAVRKLAYYISHYEAIEESKQKAKESRPIEDLSIEVLDLSVRAYNCLRRGKIHTIEDLISTPECELYNIRSLGKKTIKEIKTKMDELGLEFAEFSE